MSAAASLAPPPHVLAETRALYRALSGTGAAPQTILHGIDLQIARAEFLALTGASGSGKSTLLYLLGALDRPTSGEVWLDGVEMSSLDDDDRAAFRNERLGFVFQFHFLLPEFNVLENVSLPMLRRGVPRSEADDRAYESLGLLGLEDLWRRKPGQLSGGQQQRVSIARAVANDPALILADEPTGNLDSRNAELVFDVFAHLAHDQGRTVVMVTHDREFAIRADRQVALRDGRVLGEGRRGEDILPSSRRLLPSDPP
ncbi:MAG: ABC transporter ATP-binding protein [Deltaproteobacteria bacterium]|nr:ABC transporter ATP-binding protein [Deltaproteobacteria bacterium]